LEGPLQAFNEAFRIDIRNYACDKGVYQGHPGPAHVPARLRDAVDCILGLDDVPLLDGPYAIKPPRHGTRPLMFAPLQVADYYRFPPNTNGKGQRIALIEFAGGYHFSDIETYFKKRGIKLPVISHKCVHKARNNPLSYGMLQQIVAMMEVSPEQALRQYADTLAEFANTLEVTMDLQIAGSLAPGAEFVVYFAPPTGQAWREAIYAALEDPPASVISISWGNAEYRFSEPHLRGIEDALNAARLHHVTVCCSSGDYGSRATSWGVESNGLANVAFPASSPLVLACGGTKLQTSGKRIKGEVAWNERARAGRFASGGGISGRFFLPDYQSQASVPTPQHRSRKKTWLGRKNAASISYRGRGVPDVAAHADTTNGYQLVLGGRSFPGGGTSATAPLWAALIARINESLGFQIGWANPILYHPEVAQTFRPITRGTNDVCEGRIAYYRARAGWNACSGLGTPDGARLLEALREVLV
jgi:kumamolisin